MQGEFICIGKSENAAVKFRFSFRKGSGFAIDNKSPQASGGEVLTAYDTNPDRLPCLPWLTLSY